MARRLRPVRFVVSLRPSSAVDFPGKILSRDHEAGDRGVVDAVGEIDFQLAVIHRDAPEAQVEGAVEARAAEDVHFLGDFFSLEGDVENPASFFLDLSLTEFQDDVVGPVGKLQAVAEDAVPDVLVDCLFFRPGDGGAGEGDINAVDRTLLLDRGEGISPGLLVPGGGGQGRDVRGEGAGPPMDSEEPVASVGQGIDRVLAHATRPELRGRQGGIVLEPGDGPFGASSDPREHRVNRRLPDLAVDAARGHYLGQGPVEERPVARRAKNPAAGRKSEGDTCLGRRRASRQGIIHDGLDGLFVRVAPGPVLVRPEPVVVQGIGLLDAVEESLVDLLDDSRVLRIQALFLQAFLDQRRDGERHFGAGAGLDSQASGKGEGSAQHGRGAVKDRI